MLTSTPKASTGGTVASFIDYLYLDAGYANVSGISLEQLELTYTQFAGISEGVDTWMENMELNNTSITSDGTLFNPGIPSIQELMSYLDAPLTTSSTVVYIPDTNFPDSGKLLVGKELVTYTSKLPDRLIGVARESMAQQQKHILLVNLSDYRSRDNSLKTPYKYK